MSIFDRFASKKTGGQDRKSTAYTPYRERASKLGASGERAKEKYPEDSAAVENFVWALKEANRERNKKSLEGELLPMKAEAKFFLSKDRLAAYACVLPPENQGEALTLEEFLRDMHYEGIQYGVLEESIPQDFAMGYFHIFPVARGKAPQPGEDGKVIELFQCRRSMRLDVQNGSQVEFGADAQLQPIRKGTAICMIRPPKPGIDGIEVTGQKAPCPAAASAQVPQGENTAIGRNGLALMASVDGILYMEEDRFCIHEQRILDGDLVSYQGVLEVSGSLYIGGSVDGGVQVEATGDIVIQGKVGQARVRSTGGTIRVQQGIFGTQDQTFVAAAVQVQAPVVERAEVEAGTSVIAEMISNSTIRCGGTVFAMTGRGMISGSVIGAGESVLCLRIGNVAGDHSEISVGYPPEIPAAWVRLREELREVQGTIEKLWGSIAELRKKGSRISEKEALVLERLIEQRALYTEKREALTNELAEVNKALDKKSKGKVRCEKVHPTLKVQIGRLREEITTIEEKCDIRVEDNRMLMN